MSALAEIDLRCPSNFPILNSDKDFRAARAATSATSCPAKAEMKAACGNFQNKQLGIIMPEYILTHAKY